MKRALLIGIICSLCLLPFSACGTLNNMGTASYPAGGPSHGKKQPFGGVTQNGTTIAAGAAFTVVGALSLVDLPLSLVGDLVTLPSTQSSTSTVFGPSKEKNEQLLAIYQVRPPKNGTNEKGRNKASNLLKSISKKFDLQTENNEFSLELEEVSGRNRAFLVRLTIRQYLSNHEIAGKLQRHLERRFKTVFGERFSKKTERISTYND